MQYYIDISIDRGSHVTKAGVQMETAIVHTDGLATILKVSSRVNQIVCAQIAEHKSIGCINAQHLFVVV